jgi:hypothetical protein
VASPSSPSWVSFIHPALAVAGLVLGWLALRAGLTVRDARVKRAVAPAGARERHLRLARPAVALAAGSFPVGLATAVLARDMEAFRTVHGYLGAAATACFIGAALVGRALMSGGSTRRGPHVAMSLLGLLLGLVVALTGIELLP